MTEKISKLIDPIQIGKMVVKNRMVMPPMNTNFSNENGALTPQMTEYYLRRAKSGVGMIILEAASITDDSKNHGVQPMIHDEKYIPSWGNLVEQIQRYGSKVSVEIVHYGSEAELEPRVSASNISRFKNSDVKPLTIEEILDIEDKFANAVNNAKMAGFDAVTLHAAHGYLIAEFLSPVYNKRTDQYGGSLENRMRFLIEIIRKCKTNVGNDFPIMVRYSADEFVTGGRTIEESMEIAKAMEREGVSAIDISAAQPTGYIFTIPPHSLPESKGFLVPYSKEIKKVVTIPVIVASGIRDPFYAESILNNEEADMIALGRPLIADPDYCDKVIKTNFQNIRHCLSCQHCLRTLDSGKSMRCAINPETGREYEFNNLDTVKESKKVLVIGGGPAGLEAARVAKLRGHDVTLYEKSSEFGGSLKAGMVPPRKEKIKALIEWYKKQIDDLGIKVKMNQEFTAEMAKDMKPDVLIIASGSVCNRMIPGSERENVITAIDALIDPSKVGNKVVIIGGGATGSETAEFLSKEKVKIDFKGVNKIGGELIYTTKQLAETKGKDIKIIEMLDEVCSDMDNFNRPIMQITLKENGIKVFTSTKVKEISDKGIEVINIHNQEEKTINADTVILAGGLKPNDINCDNLNTPEVFKIGDCKKIGRIADAIYEGYIIAKSI